MMNQSDKKKFKKVFGINSEHIGQTLIISPFFPAKLFRAKLKNSEFFKGLIYHGIRGEYRGRQVTFINTGVGQSLVADCVLAQDEKNTKQIIFLGAAGALQNLKIGDCVYIKKAFYDTDYFKKFGFDFTQEKVKSFAIDNSLIKIISQAAKPMKKDFKQASIISLHTLWDQNRQVIDKIIKMNIDCIDLECALFYAAAASKKIRAAALCYISDLAPDRPYWGNFSIAEKSKIEQSVSRLVCMALNTAGTILT